MTFVCVIKKHILNALTIVWLHAQKYPVIKQIVKKYGYAKICHFHWLRSLKGSPLNCALQHVNLFLGLLLFFFVLPDKLSWTYTWLSTEGMPHAKIQGIGGASIVYIANCLWPQTLRDVFTTKIGETIKLLALYLVLLAAISHKFVIRLLRKMVESIASFVFIKRFA